MERPHGLSYSLVLRAPDGERLVGYDNAHPVRDGEALEHGGGARATIDTGCGPQGRMIQGNDSLS